MNVSKSDDGEITLENEVHGVSFSFNKQVTPESEDDKQINQTVNDVINTPRNFKTHISIGDMD